MWASMVVNRVAVYPHPATEAGVALPPKAPAANRDRAFPNWKRAAKGFPLGKGSIVPHTAQARALPEADALGRSSKKSQRCAASSGDHCRRSSRDVAPEEFTVKGRSPYSIMRALARGIAIAEDYVWEPCMRAVTAPPARQAWLCGCVGWVAGSLGEPQSSALNH